MLLCFNEGINYIDKLILIMEYFNNYNRKCIKSIAPAGYIIASIPKYHVFRIDKDDMIMFCGKEGINFIHTSGYRLGMYTLNEDNTLDKLTSNSKHEILIENFTNEFYEELQLLNQKKKNKGE